MTTTELLAQLRELGITVRAENGVLKVSAPAGALTEALRTALAGRKIEIIELLEQTRRQRMPSPVSRHGTEGSPQRAPLALQQQRMWFFERAQPGTSVMNIAVGIRMRGAIDDEALEHALRLLASRHDMLRVRIEDSGSGPEQIVQLDASFPFSHIDLRRREPADAEREVRRLFTEEVETPFDLGRCPLWRARLVHVAIDQRVLLLTFHHVIADGWSLGVMVRDIAEFYTALVEHRQPSLPELTLGYLEYASSQASSERDDMMARQLEYWRTKLEGELPILDLPSDAPRPPFQTYSGGSVGASLSPESVNALSAIARRQGASLFMLLVAAFKVLMARVAGQPDVIVGTPIAGREGTETEPLVGLFINMLALRTQVDPSATFESLLGRVRETALEAYAHQSPPFERVVQQARVRRDPSRTPIFQVLFNMGDGPFSPPERLGGATLSLEGMQQPRSRFDLTMYAGTVKDRVEFSLVYNADLFAARRAAELLAQYVGLLDQIATTPEALVQSFSLLTDGARDVLPDPAEPMPASGPEPPVQRLVLEQIARAPDRVAIVGPSDEWSYRELGERSGRVATALQRAGVAPGKRVAIVAYRSPELVAAILGAWRAGTSVIILDVAYPASRLVACVDVAMPDAVIHLDGAGESPAALQTRLDKIGVAITIPASGHEIDAAFETYEGADVESTGDTEAYVAFTSGTTGTPRGILGTHAPVSHFLKWHVERFDIGENDRVSMLSGLSHDPLLRDVFTPLVCGGTLVVPDPDELVTPGWLADWMRREHVTVAHLTPAMAAVVTGSPDDAPETISSLRRVFFGGEALRPATITGLATLAPSAMFINFYGTTETPQAMAYYVVDGEGIGTTVPLGGGIDGVQILVLTSGGARAGIGELGEIYVRTKYLSRGYVDDNDTSATRFIANPFGTSGDDRLYRTGDMGRFLPDGSVAYAGRNDAQVKVRGYRVELSEIETALARHESVQRSVVTLHREATGDRLAAYLVLKDGAEPMASELRKFLRRDLPEYMIPALFVPVTAIPLTPNGKVDRKALVPPDTLSRRDRERVAPRTTVERAVAEIWADVLGVTDISVHDNFFDIGGHSLNSIQVVARLEKQLGVTVHPGHLILESLEQISAACEKQLQSASNRDGVGRGAPVIDAGQGR